MSRLRASSRSDIKLSAAIRRASRHSSAASTALTSSARRDSTSASIKGMVGPAIETGGGARTWGENKGQGGPRNEKGGGGTQSSSKTKALSQRATLREAMHDRK